LGRAAALFELPGDDAVQNVGARLETEHVVVQLDVALALASRVLTLTFMA
jgi:hypothetical protein